MISSAGMARGVKAALLAIAGDQFQDLGIGRAGARIGAVAVPAATALLAEAAGGDDGILDGRDPCALGQFETLGLADQLSDIEADQIGHGEGPHGHAEIVQRLVDVVGARTFLDKEFGLAPIGIESPIGDESVADPGHHGLLVDRLGDGQRRCQHIGARSCRHARSPGAS